MEKGKYLGGITEQNWVQKGAPPLLESKLYLHLAIC
jgi:hypothetical protein